MYGQQYLLHLLLVICLVFCNGQVLQFGTCPDVKTMQYFDVEEFLGQWYEIERFPIWYEQYDPIGIPFSVISTDYKNYAVVYGCKNNESLGLKYISAWILSRQSTLPEEYLSLAYRDVNSVPSVSQIYMEKVNHSATRCSSYWTAHIQPIYFNQDGQK
ncbi:hypothetical protein HF086_013581 [Spodoptera exigua]|uniref:Lipocalin/cytosolic fatty-acid binding domain-containing protein n=1 Tax=Spodoptera exigua TaxID=7107 RepID=A0A922MV89_SPOEX|nr:hypothetical protein HF086_013581 [Spodoptera exigua]